MTFVRRKPQNSDQVSVAPGSDVGATHILIPDCQVRPGVNTDHLGWIGQYIVDQFSDKPNVKIVNIGDFWDMSSLSSFDKGKKEMEGRRIDADIEAGNDAFKLLCKPMEDFNASRRRHRRATWDPEKHFTMGNHEYRIVRATSADAQLDGLLSLDCLDTRDWQRHDFLDVLWLDDVAYSHYFYNPMSGRPYSGMMETRIKNVGHSFTMGHQQGFWYGLRNTIKGTQHGLVAGSCYSHDEEYKGPQGNDHWRGIVVCHEVRSGQYDMMQVSLDYLSRRYEGKSLKEFMNSK